MDLKAKKEEIEKQLQQNKIDRSKHEQTIKGLDRGADYLSGQIDLLKKLMAEQEVEEAVEIAHTTNKDAVTEPLELNKGN